MICMKNPRQQMKSLLTGGFLCKEDSRGAPMCAPNQLRVGTETGTAIL